MNPLDLINKLAAQDSAERSREFIAPFLPNSEITIRICNVVKKCPVVFKRRKKKEDRAGFGIFQLTGDFAVYQQEASRRMVAAYAENFPSTAFILIEIEGEWFGIQAARTSIEVQGPVRIQCLDNPEQFQLVQAFFDGVNFWYLDQVKTRLQVLNRLRQEIISMTPPDLLRIPGMIPSERLAYKMSWIARKPKSAYDPASGLSERERIDLALSQAGAQLDSISARAGNQASVTFTRSGKSHTVTIDRNTLQVTSSGICLSGKDRDFDLTSLVSVFNEGERNDYDWH